MLSYHCRAGKTLDRQPDSMTDSAAGRGGSATNLDRSRRRRTQRSPLEWTRRESHSSTIAHKHARWRIGRDNLWVMCERRRAQDAFRPLVGLFKLPTMVKSTKCRLVRDTAREGDGAQGYARGMNATCRAKNGYTNT